MGWWIKLGVAICVIGFSLYLGFWHLNAKSTPHHSWLGGSNRFRKVLVTLWGWVRVFFRIDVKPKPRAALLLSMVFFVLFGSAYLIGSYKRYHENPDDKIMPIPSKLIEGFERVAFQADREGQIRLWTDSWASAKRFFTALAVILLAVILGVNMGLLPYWEASYYRFLLFFDKIPAVSLLPIIFVVFGLGEFSKLALIVIGVFPTVALDAYLRAKAVPREQIDKAHTLGATDFEVVYRVVLPQIFPKVLDTIRLNFKTIIGLLIVAESIAAEAGLGYRIFVVRRYMAMDIIIPYVFWITAWAFFFDWLVQLWISRYRWVDK